jgi:hypothetical protein
MNPSSELSVENFRRKINQPEDADSNVFQVLGPHWEEQCKGKATETRVRGEKGLG